MKNNIFDMNTPNALFHIPGPNKLHSSEQYIMCEDSAIQM